jgi:hypothetical protein
MKLEDELDLGAQFLEAMWGVDGAGGEVELREGFEAYA